MQRSIYPDRLILPLLAAALLGALPLGLVSTSAAYGQTPFESRGNADAELLLSAQELIYDNNSKTVTARGAVQMDYDGYNVVAERVSYNQRTRRVKAFGKVEIVEPNGNRVYADEIDLTDDFADGFVNALRVETPDNTRFAAESAERQPGDRTVFNNGVYTACEVCAENPQKPPVWQIKAEKVVVDGVEQTVTYRNASFEMFGTQIAALPYFSHADPSIKRKQGFLFPNVGHNSDLGYFYRQPYFIPTSRSTDLTLAGTYYTKQGFLADVLWRHQLENGFYSVRAAGIRQADKGAFTYAPGNKLDLRGMVATKGLFNINPRWTFGWDWMEQSDVNFSRTYSIRDWSAQEITNEVYLRGLADRSYFDLAVQQFQIQPGKTVNPNTVNYSYFYGQDQQAFARPIFDYNYQTTDAPVGGLVSLDMNVQSLERSEQDLFVISGNTVPVGIDGSSTRATAELKWKRTFTSRAGLLLTPELSIRGDWMNVDARSYMFSPGLLKGSGTRFVGTAGLTASYPVMFNSVSSTHIVEPIAQIFARPDVNNDALFVNEDARSLVFDTTNLLQANKFSGYDRVEEGVRANVALRYAGYFGNGLTVNAKIGQSYHLAGENAYARMDGLTNTGAQTGLDTDVSDIVSSIGFTSDFGFALNHENRFDKDDFEVKRATLSSSYTGYGISARLGYTYIAKQPALRYYEDREQVGGHFAYTFAENWTASAGAAYDLSDKRLISDRYGLTYTDECYTFSLNFARSHPVDGKTDSSVGFRFGFRTLGDIGYTVGDAQLSSFSSSGLLSGSN